MSYINTVNLGKTLYFSVTPFPYPQREDFRFGTKIKFVEREERTLVPPSSLTPRHYPWLFWGRKDTVGGTTHLLGGLVAVIFLPPELGLHLQTHILKVYVPVHRLNVALCHIVGGPFPLLGMQEVGELLPEESQEGPGGHSGAHWGHSPRSSGQQDQPDLAGGRNEM